MAVRDEEAGAAEAPGTWMAVRRRLYTRRGMSTALLAAFLLALMYPLYSVPRLRYALRAVPAIHGEHAPAVPAATLAQAEALVAAEVRRQGFPGASLAVGGRGKAFLEVGVGRTGWRRLSEPVDPDATLYDLASVTKLMGTTTAVMLLVDDGKLRLDEPVAHWVPEFTGHGREKVTIRQLLTHTSGLPAGRPLGEGSPREKLLRLIATVPLIAEPGDDVLYSDVGFVVLGEAAARAAGEPLPAFLRRRVWQPLGMAATRYQPGLGCGACAPTLTLEDGTPFAGKTNDPMGRDLGGMTGNAGLFSTAHDVGRWAAMIANGGSLGGVRIIRPETLREFLTPQKGAGTRALGFEWFCQEGTVPDQRGCKTFYAYGHTGYTGTSVWIDPRRGVWVVLLSNRSYMPKAPNRIRVLRRKLFNLVTGTQVAPAKVQSDTSEDRH